MDPLLNHKMPPILAGFIILVATVPVFKNKC